MFGGALSATRDNRDLVGVALQNRVLVADPEAGSFIPGLLGRGGPASPNQRGRWVVAGRVSTTLIERAAASFVAGRDDFEALSVGARQRHCAGGNAHRSAMRDTMAYPAPRRTPRACGGAMLFAVAVAVAVAVAAAGPAAAAVSVAAYWFSQAESKDRFIQVPRQPPRP